MSYPSTWVALVSDINTEVVARLAAAGYPALTQEIDGSAGKILLGSSFPAEFSSPPRVAFVPQPSKLEGPTRSVAGRAGMPAPEQAAMLSTRAIARRWKSFKVYCWACNFSDQTHPAPDPALDYDAAQALSEIVWQSCQAIAAGVWRGEGTVAIDGQGDVPTLVRLGRVFIFDLALDTPVLDTALAFAPSGVEQGPGKVNVVVGGVAVQAYP